MTEDLKTMNVKLKDPNEAIALLGNGDSNLQVLEKELGWYRELIVPMIRNFFYF